MSGRRSVARLWRGRAADAARGRAYLSHLEADVLPVLDGIRGYRGARVLRRSDGEGVEFLVLTFWDSMEAVRRFAGREPERAVVEPRARAVLVDFDDRVRHYDVVAGMTPSSG